MLEFHFDTIRSQLQQPGDGVFRDTAWLQESRRHPDDFGRALLRHHAARAPAPLKSNPEAGYDFYHDLVLRHQGEARPALQWMDHESALHSLTHAELHAACSLRRAAWARQGVRAGAGLCIIATGGPELLVALLTALRMGLRVSLLPPLGPDFLARRLRALPGARIAAARRYWTLLPPSAQTERVLTDEPAANLAPSLDSSSHTYAPDETAFALFSPMSAPLHEPIPVAAAPAYRGALHDGLLLLGLQPGKVLAAPDHPLQQHQPVLLLTALLHGATFLHLTARDLSADSGLTPPPIDVLLLSGGARDAMLRLRPRPLRGLGRWVVDPLEPSAQAWDDWARRYGAHAAPASALLLDGASGGAVLFSLTRLGSPPTYLQPAPGRPFKLLAADDSGEPARDGHGVFDPLPGSGGILLSSRDGAFVYAGTLVPTRHGRVYPPGEIEESVAGLPFVLGASVVPGGGDSAEAVLLIFTGPEPLATAHELSPRREAALRERIKVKLGEEFMPAHIVQYALFPRCKESSLDHAWCAQQHRRGVLRRREKHPLFRLLDRLRAACTRSYAPPAPEPPAPAAKPPGAEALSAEAPTASAPLVKAQEPKTSPPTHNDQYRGGFA